MKKFFRNPAHQDFYEKHGYVKIQILDAQDMETLWELCRSMPPPTADLGFHTSLFYQNMEPRIRANEIISSVMWKKTEPLMENCRHIMGSFLTKEKGKSGEVLIHQDWTFVDEENGNRSFNVWCPIMATNETNGNLYVLPGSHHLPLLPRVAPDSYSPYMNEKCMQFIREHSIAVPTKAGEAIIYDNTLIHFSPPNTTNEARVAAALMVVPRDAQMVLLTGTNTSFSYKKYYVKDDFYLGYGYVNNPGDECKSEDAWFTDTYNPYRSLQRCCPPVA